MRTGRMPRPFAHPVWESHAPGASSPRRWFWSPCRGGAQPTGPLRSGPERGARSSHRVSLPSPVCPAVASRQSHWALQKREASDLLVCELSRMFSARLESAVLPGGWAAREAVVRAAMETGRARGDEQKAGSTAFCADTARDSRSGQRLEKRPVCGPRGPPSRWAAGSPLSPHGTGSFPAQPASVSSSKLVPGFYQHLRVPLFFFFFFVQQNPSGQSPTWSLWGARGFGALCHASSHSALRDGQGSRPGLGPRGFSVSPTLPHDGTDPRRWGSLCLPSSTMTPLHHAWMDGSGGGARKGLASASQRGDHVPSTLRSGDDHSRPVSSHRNGVLGRLVS